MAEGETMGQALKRIRESKGMSQPKLAQAAGIPVGTLRNWEQDRRVPLLDTAARVAVALGVSLDELAGIRTAGGDSPDMVQPPPSQPAPQPAPEVKPQQGRPAPKKPRGKGKKPPAV